jgi:hypothetical protein
MREDRRPAEERLEDALEILRPDALLAREPGGLAERLDRRRDRALPASFTTLASFAASPTTLSPRPTASSSGRTRSTSERGPAATTQSCLTAAASGRPKTVAAM